MGLHVLIVAFAFLVCDLYRISYRTFAMVDMIKLGIALFIVFVLETVFMLANESIGFSHTFIYTLLLFCGICSVRFAIRFRIVLLGSHSRLYAKERVIIVGVGDAGTSIIREMQNTSKIPFVPVAAVDDDLAKQNMLISGVRVVGTINDVKKVVADYKATRIFCYDSLINT